MSCEVSVGSIRIDYDIKLFEWENIKHIKIWKFGLSQEL